MSGRREIDADKVVAFGFDGTISSFVSGWTDAGSIPDPPVNGMRELFQKLRPLLSAPGKQTEVSIDA